MSSTRHSASPPSSRDGGQGHQQQSKPPNFSPVELRPIRKEPYASDLSLAYGSFPQKKTRPHSIHVDCIASESSSPSSMMNPFTPEASTSFNPQRGFSQDQHVSEKGRNASEWTYGTYTAASSSSDLPPQLQVYEATNEHTLDSNNIYDSGATFDTEFFGTPLSAGRNASSLFTDPSARRENQEQGFQDGWDGREMRTQQEQQQQVYHLLEGLGGGNQFNLEKSSGSVGMGMEIGRRDERSLHGRPNSAGPLHTPYKGTSETIHPSSDPYSSTFFYQPSEASTPASGGGGGGDSRPSTSSQRQLSAQNRRLRSATFTTASAPYGRTSSGQLLAERQGSGLSQSPSEVGGAGRRFAIDASASASGSLLVDTPMGNSTISTMSSPLTLSSSQENPSASSDSPSEMVGNLSFGGEPQQPQEQTSQTGNTKKAGKSGRSSFKLDRREKDRIGSKSRRDGEKDAMATLQTLLVGDQPSSSTNTSNSEGSSSKSTRITRAQILELATQTLQDREEQVQALKNLIRRERAQRVEEKLEWRSELEKVLEENQRLRSQLGHNSWNTR